MRRKTMGTIISLAEALFVLLVGAAKGSSISFGLFLNRVAEASNVLLVFWGIAFVLSIACLKVYQRTGKQEIMWFDPLVFILVLAMRAGRSLVFLGLAAQWGSMLIGFLGVLMLWIVFIALELGFALFLIPPQKNTEEVGKMARATQRIWYMMILI